MKKIGGVAVCTLALGIWACSHGAGPLPSGAMLGGLDDIDQPESYTGAALYTYMDGGAEFYMKQGFSVLYVRRYGRGSQRFVLELFEMKDESVASRVYQSSRRRNEEKELASGCLASVTLAEIQAARGRYYLVGRNENPLASQSGALIELCRNVLTPRVMRVRREEVNSRTRELSRLRRQLESNDSANLRSTAKAQVDIACF